MGYINAGFFLCAAVVFLGAAVPKGHRLNLPGPAFAVVAGLGAVFAVLSAIGKIFTGGLLGGVAMLLCLIAAAVIGRRLKGARS